MGLLEKFGLAAWQSTSNRKCEEAIDKIDDQKKLAEIARTKSVRYWFARCYAVKKLNGDHQELFAEIAKSKDATDTRIAAAAKLNERYRELVQRTYIDIAKELKDFYSVTLVVDKIDSTTALEELARIVTNEDARISIKQALFKRTEMMCQHEFVYGQPYHPYNTGQTFRDGKCNICGKVTKEDYGWDDRW